MTDKLPSSVYIHICIYIHIDIYIMKTYMYTLHKLYCNNLYFSINKAGCCSGRGISI